MTATIIPIQNVLLMHPFPSNLMNCSAKTGAIWSNKFLRLPINEIPIRVEPSSVYELLLPRCSAGTVPRARKPNLRQARQVVRYANCGNP
jgi:hypothetical protein